MFKGQPWLVSAVAGLVISVSPPLRSWANPVISTAPQAQAQQHNLLGVTFQTPFAFSNPTAINEGVAVLYPPSAAPGEHDLLVGIMEVPTADSVIGNLSPSELMNWLRYSLDTAPASAMVTPVRRVLFGRRLQGEALVKDPSRPIYQELYIVRLSTGKRLAIKLEADYEIPLADVESLFTTVAASFQELEPNSRAWKQSLQWWKYPNSPVQSGSNPFR